MANRLGQGGPDLGQDPAGDATALPARAQSPAQAVLPDGRMKTLASDKAADDGYGHQRLAAARPDSQKAARS